MLEMEDSPTTVVECNVMSIFTTVELIDIHDSREGKQDGRLQKAGVYRTQGRFMFAVGVVLLPANEEVMQTVDVMVEIDVDNLLQWTISTSSYGGIWIPAQSLVYDVFKQLSVLHQAASCFSWHDIRDIAIYVQTYIIGSLMADQASRALTRFEQKGNQRGRLPMKCMVFSRQLKHEAAWCSTFNCLETSNTGDSAGSQQTQPQMPLYMGTVGRRLNMKKPRCSREIHSFAYQFGFCERLTWNPAESPVCDVFRQLNVLHQAASCSSCYDIRDIAIHVSTLSVPSCRATRRKHEGWDTVMLPKPRQGKSRGRGRVRTTSLPVSKFARSNHLSYLASLNLKDMKN
ncbi:hypothetical protein CSKR_110463, partial [Clonorchis sinensis]